MRILDLACVIKQLCQDKLEPQQVRYLEWAAKDLQCQLADYAEQIDWLKNKCRKEA